MPGKRTKGKTTKAETKVKGQEEGRALYVQARIQAEVLLGDSLTSPFDPPKPTQGNKTYLPYFFI